MLHVYLHDEKCGTLERDGTRYGFTFAYEPGWAPGQGRCRLSLSMPRDKSDVWEYGRCRAFFRGLLPEGRRRDLLAGRADPNDDYALLEKAGEECAGAVTVTAGDLNSLGEPIAVPVTESDLMAALRRNMPMETKVGARVRRFSLAGAQPKETLYFGQDEDPSAAPLRKAGGALLSTHIIKPTLSSEYSGLAWNELFCLRLAECLEIKVPPSWVREVDGVPCLVIARFDRAFDDDGPPRQVHQEDLCQALGVLEKYEYDDAGKKVGPGFAEMPEILRAVTVPAMARPKIRSWAVFNLLTGNADAHGKNLSVIHDRKGGVELAPFYDLVCTARYLDLTTDLAMAFGRERTPDALQKADFEQWAGDLEVKWRVAQKSVKEMCLSMVDAAENVRTRMPHGGRTVATGIIQEIRRRVQMVSDVFGFGIDARPEPTMRAPGWRLPS
jgi:serine/threonine-protein kinase HipA